MYVKGVSQNDLNLVMERCFSFCGNKDQGRINHIMNGRLFGACFSVFMHKMGAIASQMIIHLFCNSPTDYSFSGSG